MVIQFLYFIVNLSCWKTLLFLLHIEIQKLLCIEMRIFMKFYINYHWRFEMYHTINSKSTNLQIFCCAINKHGSFILN